MNSIELQKLKGYFTCFDEKLIQISQKKTNNLKLICELFDEFVYREVLDNYRTLSSFERDFKDEYLKLGKKLFPNHDREKNTFLFLFRNCKDDTEIEEKLNVCRNYVERKDGMSEALYIDNLVLQSSSGIITLYEYFKFNKSDELKIKIQTFNTIGFFLGYVGYTGLDNGVKIPNLEIEETKKNVISYTMEEALNSLRLCSQSFFKDQCNHEEGEFSYLFTNENNPYFIEPILKSFVKTYGYKEISQVAFNGDKNNVLITGEGGIGKTILSYLIWEHYLKSDNNWNPAPFYIPLYHYNHCTRSDIENHSFLMNFIINNYFKKDQSLKAILESVLGGGQIKKKQPSLVLILDGLNEITENIATFIRHELKSVSLFRNNNIQIIITTRDCSDNQTLDKYKLHNYQEFSVLGLSKNHIKKYLKKNKVVYPDNDNVIEIIKNPLMLSLYADSNEFVKLYKEDTSNFDFLLPIENRGEIFWNNSEARIASYFHRHHFNLENDIYLFFKLYIKIIIPYIAYNMEKKGNYEISKTALFNLLDDISLKVFKQNNFLMTHEEYLEQTFYIFNTEDNFDLKRKKWQEFLTFLNRELVLIPIKINEKIFYRFQHRIWRNFYSSYNIINDLRNSNKSRRIPKLFLSRPIPLYIRKWITEIVNYDEIKLIFDNTDSDFGLFNIVTLNFESYCYHFFDIKTSSSGQYYSDLQKKLEELNISINIENDYYFIIKTAYLFELFDFREIFVNIQLPEFDINNEIDKKLDLTISSFFNSEDDNINKRVDYSALDENKKIYSKIFKSFAEIIKKNPKMTYTAIEQLESQLFKIVFTDYLKRNSKSSIVRLLK